MTLPRVLELVEDNGSYLLTSNPVQEFESICTDISSLIKFGINQEFELTGQNDSTISTFELTMSINDIRSFSITLSNDREERLVVGYTEEMDQFYIDRSMAGETGFHDQFGKIHYAPRLTDSSRLDIRLIVDVASIEMFADSGRTVMTEIFFPSKELSRIKINADKELIGNDLKLRAISSIWR